MKIFISIAAYRDPELAPTIRDCIARAAYPSDLTFGVCWQHGAEEPAPEEFLRPKMRVIDVDWRESRGACWARAEIMKLWEGEDFFLQLDSHHRFAPHWDAILLSQMEESGADKPVMTAYGAPYDPRAPACAPGQPLRMDFHYFDADGIPLFRPRFVADWHESRPMRARFLSAHFLFAPGKFVVEAPYDPDLYFHGEEITLAIRAFSHGYDLFHPSKHVLWHEYTRDYRAKHWGDHLRGQGVAVEWHERDARSREKVRRLLLEPDDGPFGCGAQRSLADYEAFAGLNFRHRSAQDATLRGDEPPNPPASTDWPLREREWRIRLALDGAALPRAAFEDPQFWYVGFHDSHDREIFRQDAQEEELQQLLDGETERIVIERRFRSVSQPATWTVWPYGRGAGWLDKVTRPLDSGMLW